jgi:hypothetical protein
MLLITNAMITENFKRRKDKHCFVIDVFLFVRNRENTNNT